MKQTLKTISIFATPIIILVIAILWDSFSNKNKNINADYKQSDSYEQSAIKTEIKKSKDGVPELEWELLHKLDYKTGSAPSELKDLHNKKVRIPGFIVPLNDDYTELDEFLLVPDAMSCIHVPPPPPNLIVHVKLNKKLKSSEVSNPSWVEGILKIETSKSMYGKSGYTMEGIKLEKFEF